MLATWFILPSERDNLANAVAIRNTIRGIIQKRRKQPTNGSDLLSMLLKDPLFSNDDEIMIDELLTIFFAGSQTTALGTSNLLFHLLQNPKYETQILDELNQVIVQPFLSKNPSVKYNICDLYDLEQIQSLEIFSNCFNESIRIQPPVTYSSTM